jgi:hypothetical protein
MSATLKPEDIAQVEEATERLQAVLADLPPLVQLDALLVAYVKLGEAHGELEKVGTSLLELGGSFTFRAIFRQSQRPAKTTSPAPSRADYPPAPNTRQ